MRAIATMALGLGLLGAAHGAEIEPATGANLQIDVQQPFAGAVLSLQRPDGVIEIHQFEARSAIQFPTPADDGAYKWELMMSPVLPEAVQARLARVPQEQRESMRNELAQQGLLRRVERLSGSFAIENGALLPALEEESKAAGPAATKDQQILDDLIVVGSTCVGFDCVNGESFGFDTIRLKENNTRLHFNDTSTSASFPGNDWRVVANDSSNGGGNYLAIEDSSAGRQVFRVEAAAPANALYVDSGGRIGLGTSNPVVETHVVDGDTPTLRMEQDGSSGFGTQTWDLAGNETNFFLRDASNGSTLPFRVFPNVPSNTLTLEGGSGDVGMGTSSPAARLHINDNGTDPVMRVDGNGNVDEIMTLDNTGNMVIKGTLGQLSSRHSKENFQPVDGDQVLGSLSRLSVSTWNYKHQPDEVRHLGPVAEEFYAAFGLGTDEQHIAPADMAAVALAAVKSLMAELEQRDQQIEGLTQRLEALEAKRASSTATE